MTMRDAYMGYFDKNGMPLSMMEWARLNQEEYKRIAETTLESGYWVSTVWLGLDHRFGESGPPLIFETMVFKKTEVGLEMGGEDQDRYATMAEALTGHERMCLRWANGPPADP